MGSRAGLGVDDELPHAYANARVDALAKHRGFPHGEPSERTGRERVRSTRSREPRKACRCCHGYCPTNANRT